MSRLIKVPNLDYASLLEARLNALLPAEEQEPQVLHRAMRYVVLSSGKRLRPRLLLAVFTSCQAQEPRPAEIELALHAACAVEMVHTASLVHDDLPSFDNSEKRRGRPTAHVCFGEPIAILAGDALLSLAFEVLTYCTPQLARRILHIIRLLGTLTGSRDGIIGGQSLEGDAARAGTVQSNEGLARYHEMKTAALFRFAAEAGAIAAGHQRPELWGRVGYCIGRAYQMADDLMDVCADEESASKSVRADAALGRPNAVLMQGKKKVLDGLQQWLAQSATLAGSLASREPPLTALLDELQLHLLKDVA